MQRLTERFSNGQAAVYGCGSNCKYDFKYCENYLEDCPTINEIYEKLATYEDSFPCDIGEDVWFWDKDRDSIDYAPLAGYVAGYEISFNKTVYMVIAPKCGIPTWQDDNIKLDVEFFGKYIFTSKEEAIEKLRKEYQP